MKAPEAEVDLQQLWRLSWQQLSLSFFSYYFMYAKALDQQCCGHIPPKCNKDEVCRSVITS